ncbi:sphingomyelin phosphodiesterase [Plakobranchus ocellatus]|uniref:Sphingomyelin phosphodiesterase n=1 Tax=Plakobranchus ocellatus TaxID=259542 RepID=A0AAV4A598_9GAST|nr:sphingomyelin phosphodiesterase [Plakobranchus ocellatus]
MRFVVRLGTDCNPTFGGKSPEILTVLDTLVLSPDEVCGIVVGPNCGDPYNPLDNWNVTFPNVPQPAPVPPIPPKPGSPTLRVLHLSDTHYDAHYKAGSNANCGEPLCCRQDDGVPANTSDGAGKFGDYRNCDTPLWTLENMLQKLSAEKDTFDFIYWTGDLPAHDVWNQTRQDQLNILQHMVSLMLKYFPGKPVFPSLGNHEGAPVNSFPPPYITGKYSISWLYDALAQSWSNWLPKDVIALVQKGAYYTVSPHPGFRIISLNTNYCNSGNWWMLINTTDPTGELTWLIKTLQSAENAGEKVHILGHIPPGDQGCLKAWSWNYYRVVNRYQNIIAGQFYGHTHYDSFQVFYDETTLSKPVGVAYTAPSVTSYPGLNMGYRFYTVDGVYKGSSYQVLDHETFFLNLAKANVEGKITWEFEYSAKATYKMKSLYPSDWDNLIKVMMANQTVLETYNRLYFKSVHSGACDYTCRYARLCETRSARSSDPSLCKDLKV